MGKRQYKKGKTGKGVLEPKAQTAEAYTGFLSMKLPGSIATPPWTGCLSIADGRGLNPGPPDPEFEVLTAPPHTRPQNAFFITLFLLFFQVFYISQSYVSI